MYHPSNPNKDESPAITARDSGCRENRIFIPLSGYISEIVARRKWRVVVTRDVTWEAELKHHYISSYHDLWWGKDVKTLGFTYR